MDGAHRADDGNEYRVGVQFDSLADVVSFGIAPRFWRMRGVSICICGFRKFHQLGEFAWICCLTFLICTAWRPGAVQREGHGAGREQNFVGMPTPAAAGVVAAIIHSRHQAVPIGDTTWRVCGLYCCLRWAG